MNKYYLQIDTALKSYETFKPYHQYSIDWITDRISWCWKWKKISADEMMELVERTIDILKIRS